jgi:hypothetical protein
MSLPLKAKGSGMKTGLLITFYLNLPIRQPIEHAKSACEYIFRSLIIAVKNGRDSISAFF